MSQNTNNFSTQVIHAGEQSTYADNTLFPAIVTSSSFSKRSLDDNPDYAYGRVGNPTRHAYETCIAQLEHGHGAVACASGMAAAKAVCVAVARHHLGHQALARSLLARAS